MNYRDAFVCIRCSFLNTLCSSSFPASIIIRIPLALLNQESVSFVLLFSFISVPPDALNFHFASALVSNASGELREPQGSV